MKLDFFLYNKVHYKVHLRVHALSYSTYGRVIHVVAGRIRPHPLVNPAWVRLEDEMKR